MLSSSESISKISVALVAASKNIGGAVKGSINPHFKSRYANLTGILEAVKGPLEEQDIIILQPIRTDAEGKSYLETRLLHSSGEFIASHILLDISGKAQEFGSRISYLRRYQLQSLLSIPALDDDAEGTMQRGQTRD